MVIAWWRVLQRVLSDRKWLCRDSGELARLFSGWRVSGPGDKDPGQRRRPSKRWGRCKSKSNNKNNKQEREEGKKKKMRRKDMVSGGRGTRCQAGGR